MNDAIHMKTLLKQAIFIGLVLFGLLCQTNAANFVRDQAPNRHYHRTSGEGDAKPKPAPLRWRGLIGEYGSNTGILYILEKDGSLCALFKGASIECLEEISKNTFKFPPQGSHSAQLVIFLRDAKGRATLARIEKAEYARRQIEPEGGAPQLHVDPLRPVKELLKEARVAEPPKESGEFRPTDLVELKKLISTIKLDIRYATTNNLFGTVFYSEARAFMQRRRLNRLTALIAN